MKKIMFKVIFFLSIVLLIGSTFIQAIDVGLDVNVSYLFSNINKEKAGTYFSGYSVYKTVTTQNIGKSRSIFISGVGVNILNFEQMKSIKIPNGTGQTLYSLSGGSSYLFFNETQIGYNIIPSNSVIFTPLLGFYGQLGILKQYEQDEYEYLFKRENKFGGSLGAIGGIAFGVFTKRVGILLRADYLYNLVGNIKGSSLRVGVLMHWDIT